MSRALGPALLPAAILSVLSLPTCLCQPASAQDAVQQVKKDAHSIYVHCGSQLVMEYRFAEVPFKPYLKQLSTPGGVQLLRDSPFDHKHHHALMFAIGADGVDFWSETPDCGRQVSTGIEDPTSMGANGKSQVSFTEKLDWVSPGNAGILQERRTLTLNGGPAIKPRLLTWRSSLKPAAGKAQVRLTGSHYFGLGMRFVEAMDKAGRFFNSEGTEGPIVRGSEQVTPAKWCAYVSKVDEKPVTVAMFDHPKNARPAHFFTMRPFAYLSATINLWKEPLDLKADAPLDLRYGVAVWDGEMGPKEVEDAYKRWKEIGK